jgi:hypothetical protein
MNDDEPVLPLPPDGAGGLWVLNDDTQLLEPVPLDDAPGLPPSEDE